jgi:CBS domain-containing protein
MDLARTLRSESVRRLNATSPVVVRLDQTVADAVAQMQQREVGCVLVVGPADGRVVGIFTERDLIQKVMAPGLPLATPIQSVMVPDPVTVTEAETIHVALKRMQKGGYRHLPVVDETGLPTGVLSVKRIVHYLVEYFPSTIYNLPPNPDSIQHDREGA